MDAKDLRVMTSFLADRSVRVRRRIELVLERQLAEIRPVLSEILAEERDPLIRERLTLLLGLDECKGALEQWRFLHRHLSLGLREGFVALSLTDVDGAPGRVELLEKIMALSDEWSAQFSARTKDEDKVAGLMDYLFASKRFSGNTDDYYSLDNCYLHRLLSGGRGLPVTLCTLAVILAEDEGLPLYGIGLPLHFIVGHFQGSRGLTFYDCFDGGREVTREECASYLQSRGIFFHPQLLSPCSNESILTRIVVNLKHIAQRRKLHAHLAGIEPLAALDIL